MLQVGFSLLLFHPRVHHSVRFYLTNHAPFKSTLSAHTVCRYADHPMSKGFSCTGGLLVAEAVELLRQFYAAGNPNGEARQLVSLGLHCSADNGSLRMVFALKVRLHEFSKLEDSQ